MNHLMKPSPSASRPTVGDAKGLRSLGLRARPFQASFQGVFGGQHPIVVARIEAKTSRRGIFADGFDCWPQDFRNCCFRFSKAMCFPCLYQISALVNILLLLESRDVCEVDFGRVDFVWTLSKSSLVSTEDGLRLEAVACHVGRSHEF